jgi:radical SAM protein with 4Fe4S-binding SPASM domain
MTAIFPAPIVANDRFSEVPPLRGRVVLQWHLTERCNLRCAHCYQEGGAGEELPFRDLLRILAQFKELVGWLGEEAEPFPVKGQINVSGGEPFLRNDFFDLLSAFHAERDWLSFAILTNGTYIDDGIARSLRGLDAVFVQVSMEGGKETNDAIRGAGAYDRTIEALRCLIRERVPSSISFTAHRDNFREFPRVVQLGCELGVGKVWADRLIPCGSGSSLGDKTLTPEETREFFEIMYQARSEAARVPGKTAVSLERALQFLVGGGVPYRCAAGKNLVTVLPNGDLLPCRRMPIRVGNLLDTPLLDLYRNDPLFLALRDQGTSDGKCGRCTFSDQCRGGLRSYAITGDPFRRDPGCWRPAAIDISGRDAGGKPEPLPECIPA